jgi:hypothetical protein
MMQHVRSIPENLAATDQQLHELYTASEVCQLSILELEERSQHLEVKNTEHSTLLEDMGSRLAAAEHGIDALPPWKRAYEQKMLEREEDAKAKHRKLEDKDEELQSLVEQHMARMMERLPAICFLLELCAAAGSHSYMVRVVGNRDGSSECSSDSRIGLKERIGIVKRTMMDMHHFWVLNVCKIVVLLLTGGRQF